MIVGKGLIANAFQNFFSDDENFYIFASGVANSKTLSREDFERERNMLNEHILKSPKNSLFVYFSTCSIYDPGAATSFYVKHKIDMESIVKSCPRYLILRLPQVVGRSNNFHTLTNFLYRKISLEQKFDLMLNAKRNIIDVDDVTLISNEIIRCDNHTNEIINIANPISTSVLDVVGIFEDILRKKAHFNPKQSGSSYEIDITHIRPIIKVLGLRFGNNYVKNTLSKYYSIKLD